MEFEECGPLDLSSSRRFRFLASELLLPTLPVIGKVLDRIFFGGGGFDPRPLKIFGCTLDAEIGRDTSEYYTDAGKIEILMLGGLWPPQRHFRSFFFTWTHSNTTTSCKFSRFIVLSV